MMPTCTVAWPAAFVHSSFMALVDRGGECPWPSWVPSYHPIHHASYSASYLCTGRDLINFQYWFGQEIRTSHWFIGFFRYFNISHYKQAKPIELRIGELYTSILSNISKTTGHR